MNNPGRLLLGIGLLVAGVLFLLDIGDYVNAGSVISTWWPLAIIAFGVMALIGPARSLIGGAIITFVGLILLSASLGLLPVRASELFFPLILIAIGLGLILVRARVSASGDERNQVNGFAMFGGQTIVARTETFAGGSLTALFGSLELDLRSTSLEPGGAAVETFTMFGGTSVIVPRGWRVTISGMPLFGSFDDKIDRSIEPTPDAPHLMVSGVAAFGGVEVKHEPG
jgi:predicted membrane protein